MSDALEAVREYEWALRDHEIVAMLSGGRDSVCLLDILVTVFGADVVRALHVNYGLREQADEEERYCRALCHTLNVELEVVRAVKPVGAGNTQAWARDVRYDAAWALAKEQEAVIATGHTATDQVETILYRLAASPGRRALLGMPAVESGLIRPLLEVTREQTAAHCNARGLEWCDDETNDTDAYARGRVRKALVPALRAVHPAAEASVLRTAELLREETALLDSLVDAELGGRGSIALGRLAELHPALARLVVIRLAEQAGQGFVPQAGERVAEILTLAQRGGRAEVHVGGLVSAVLEQGRLHMVAIEAHYRAPGED